ncbi:hypothetical protein [Mesorhizobium sp. BE184]|uniref:hypothetical protein n=1 Tax=Mesorhizobium sp. BE184 TaxID=2817714 RepID=UPI002866672E|nr:hypothetical protein [Mesorhizobium sp. BE184]MDR7034482.1 hypothetical protein [Mesorhizobium sp. BE184]
MIGAVEYLSWCPDRQTFIDTMTVLLNPLTGEPLASVDAETGELVPCSDVRIDEIGPVVKTPAVFDENDDLVTPAEIVGGHHVNLAAVGDLAEALLAGGDPLAALLSLLGQMDPVPPIEGVPAGYEGTSGMRVYMASNVTHRARTWA